MKNKTNQKMKVVLLHAPNPDIDGGYWSDVPRPIVHNGGFPKGEMAPVKSYAEASSVCQAYIRKYDLGGGNWAGGDIWIGAKHVGYVSFNGRVWESRTWPSKEITL